MKLKKIISSTKSLILLILGMVIMALLILYGLDIGDARAKTLSCINWFKKLFGMDPTSKKNFTESDAKEAVEAVKVVHGTAMARLVEKMYRLETAHFKSAQYKQTGSAGMEVGKWKGIMPNHVENYTVKMHDADKSDGIDEFIVWKSPKYFALYLAEYIKRYNGNFARWNTTNTAKQLVYAKKVNEINAKFV